MSSIKIKNHPSGLSILMDYFPSKTLSIGLWINVGSTSEKKNQYGIAHMLEHLAFKGTKSRTAYDIAKDIEDIGGDINAYTSKETTAYYVKILPEYLNLGIDILSDIYTNSIFPDDEIEKERGVIILLVLLAGLLALPLALFSCRLSALFLLRPERQRLCTPPVRFEGRQTQLRRMGR